MKEDEEKEQSLQSLKYVSYKVADPLVFGF
jgi:hypothetical protein